MKKILLLITAFTCIYNVNAQTYYSLTGLSYTQDFNTMDTVTSSPSTNLPLGWSLFERGTGAAADQKYVAGYGASNAGNAYSFGVAADSDRALGSIASGSNQPHFGMAIINNTTSDINAITIAYKGEQWRLGDTLAVADSLVFEYSTLVWGMNDTVNTWTQEWGLMFNSPVVTAAAATPLVGNVAPNFTNKTGTFSVTVPVGDTIYLRWRDINITGADDGLSVDDLSINFSFSTKIKNTQNDIITTQGNLNTQLQIGINAQYDENAAIEIVNLNGQKVYSSIQKINVGTNRITLSQPQLPAGVYILRLKSNHLQGTIKISK